MKLTELMFQNITATSNTANQSGNANAANAVVRAPKSGNGFNEHLAKAENGSRKAENNEGRVRVRQNETSNDEKVRRKADDNANSGKNEEKVTEKPKERQDETRKTSRDNGSKETRSTAGKEKADDVVFTNVMVNGSESSETAMNAGMFGINVENAVVTVESAKTEQGLSLNETVKKLADALELSYEEIMAMLMALNVTPEQLSQPDGIRLLAQNLMGAESQASMLTADGAKEAIAVLEDLLMLSGEEAAAARTAARNLFNEAVKTILAETNQTQTTSVEESVKTDGLVQSVTALGNSAASRLAGTDSNNVSGQNQYNTQTIMYSTEQVTPMMNAQMQQFMGQNAEPGANQGQNSGQAPVTTDAVDQAMLNASREAALETANVQNTNRPFQANTAQIIEQIVERMRLGINPELTEMRITLRPEHLGEVSMRILSRDGIITAQIFAGSEQVRQLIEAGLERLREALLEQGVQVNELQVSVGQGQEGRESQEGSGELSASRISDILNAIEDEELPELDDLIGTDSTVSYTA
jgi:flagellar hook-length control protein FliK